MTETFGQLIYREREEVQRWTQKELARRTGLDQSTISAIERDQGIPRAATITALAVVLHFDATPWLVQFGHVLPPVQAPPLAAPAPPEDAPFAAIEAWVLALPGEAYRAGLVGARREMGDEDWEVLIRDVFRVFKGTLDMGLHQARRRR